MIVLGSKVKDIISGWEGIATARHQHLNGCERYEVSGADKDGAPEGFVFDVQQLEVLPGHPVLPKPVWRQDDALPGGPRDNTPVPR